MKTLNLKKFKWVLLPSINALEILLDYVKLGKEAGYTHTINYNMVRKKCINKTIEMIQKKIETEHSLLKERH